MGRGPVGEEGGNGGAVDAVGVTLCLRRVCLYFCRICEEIKFFF